VFMNVTTAFMRNVAQKHWDAANKETQNNKKAKPKHSKKSKRRREHRRESSFSKEESITIDSKEYNFADSSVQDIKKGGCC